MSTTSAILRPSAGKTPAQAFPSARTWTVLPLLLALFFGGWALRGDFHRNVVDTDAARHLMNGVFLHDLVRDGAYLDPAGYGRHYYGHLPALSMPYHPPLFPAIESLIFFLAGVSLTAARITVALFTALSVWLMFRLILDTVGSQAVALAATSVFFATAASLRVAGDVMLEMPSLAFALAALWPIRRLDRGLSLRAGILFALLAGAAVWTKQNTIFLGAVPFMWILITRRWDLLRSKAIWVSTALFGIFVAGVILLPRLMHFSGGNGGWPKRTPIEAALHNLWFYGAEWKRAVTVPGLILIGAVAAAMLLMERRRRLSAWLRKNALWLAWSAAAFGLLLPLPAYEGRYLFYANAGLLVVAFGLVYRVGTLAGGARRAWVLPVIAAVPLVAMQFFHSHPAFLDGPEEAARLVFAGGAPSRVIYCGESNGSFIFQVRTHDDHLRTIVIRGDKLGADTFTRAGMEDFARRYGAQYIVLERSVSQKWPWDDLAALPSPSMEPVSEIPLRSSRRSFNGSLLVYRFRNPSPNPERVMKVKNEITGRTLDVSY